MNSLEDKELLKLFEKKPGEIEFIPSLEFRSSWSYFFNKKYHKRAVRVLRNLVTSISPLLVDSIDCNGDESRGKYVIEGCRYFLSMTPKNRKKTEHIQILVWYFMTDFLVYLFKSPIKNNKEIAEESIRLFLYPNIQSFPIHVQHQFCSVVLNFCENLRDHTTTSGRLLYLSCRQTYASLLNSIGPENTNIRRWFAPPTTLIGQLYPFIRELMKQLLENMKLIRQSCFCRVPPVLKARFESDIGEFSIFALHMCSKIEEHMRSEGLPLLSLPINLDIEELEPFCDDFNELLNSVDLGLTYMDDGVEYTRCTVCEFNHGWCYYLPILKQLDMISKLHPPAKNNLYSCLNSHQVSINKLIMKSKRADDHQWLLKHKNLISDESRGHLIKMMLPDLVNNLQKLMVTIDRSKLFVDSFEQVGLANPILLRNGIIPQLKNEVSLEARPAFLREWLLLLCQHLFSPQNSLFLSCPHDHKRLFPNPAKVEAQQLKYYGFCGRVIALALMHNVQLGIGFDQLFFLQLAGRSIITLEDIRCADPYMYKSCKDIMEMDTELIDSDGLGLTFVWEANEEEEFESSRKSVELCPGGNTLVVNSMNREEYVQLIIQHCFVNSIEEKVKLFIQGLDDVLTRKRRKIFFQSIELEDLDHMLLEKTICEKESEDRSYSEAGNGCKSPFQKVLETTLHMYWVEYFDQPLTCKVQAGRIPFC